MPFDDVEIVRLRRALPEHGIAAGRIGTVVMVYTSPGPAYEVEFADGEGITQALVTLHEEDLAPISPQPKWRAVSELDFLLRARVPIERLREVFVEAFGVRSEDLALVGAWEELTRSHPVVVKVCHLEHGDFLTTCEPLADAALPRDAMWGFPQLAGALQTDVVIDGGSTDPYEFWLIERDGSASVIFLDVESLDERHEFVLDRDTAREGVTRCGRVGDDHCCGTQGRSRLSC